MLAVQILSISFGLKASRIPGILSPVVAEQNSNCQLEAYDLFSQTVPFESEKESEDCSEINLEEEVEFLPDFQTEKGVLVKGHHINVLLSYVYTSNCYLPFHPEMQSPPPKA